MKQKINILYVDDEENNLQSFLATFRMKYRVLLALNGFEAIKVMEQQPVDIIVTDHRMAQMTGIELLEIITKRFPECKRIILTGYADMNDIKAAVKNGFVHYYLEKPWKADEIESSIKLAMNTYQE
jgi:response regulator RpfG family c-di-GMP phosphodiesterase